MKPCPLGERPVPVCPLEDNEACRTRHNPYLPPDCFDPDGSWEDMEDQRTQAVLAELSLRRDNF